MYYVTQSLSMAVADPCWQGLLNTLLGAIHIFVNAQVTASWIS